MPDERGFYPPENEGVGQPDPLSEREDSILSRLRKDHTLFIDKDSGDYYVLDENGVYRKTAQAETDPRMRNRRVARQRQRERGAERKKPWFADEESALSPMQRGASSLFRGDKRERYIGKLLAERGDELVIDDAGKMFARDGKTGGLRPIDPEGFDLGDIPDVIGDVPPVALSVAGGMAGSAAGGPGFPITGPAGSILGGGGGELLTQLGAYAVDPEIQGEIEWPRVGGEAALGAVGELGGAIVPKFLTKLGETFLRHAPPKVGGVSKQFAKSLEDPLVKQTRRHAEQLGIAPGDLPVSTLSTPKSFQQAADVYLRQSPVSAGQFAKSDEAYTDALEGALGRTRERIGGVPQGGMEMPVHSGIDPEQVGAALIPNDREMRRLFNLANETAQAQYEAAVGVPFRDVPAITPRLDAISREIGEKLSPEVGQPNLRGIPEYGPIAEFFEDSNRDNLQQLMYLQQIAGDFMDSPTTRGAGEKLYAAVQGDLEATFRNYANRAPIGELQASAAHRAYRKIMDMQSRQIGVRKSPLVQRLFPHGAPNVYLLDEVAEEMSKSGVGPEAIRMLREKIGAGMSERSMTNVARKFAGKANIGLPQTEKGEFIWDQVRQLYLDNLFHKISRVPKEMEFGGQKLFNSLFGTAKQERVTREIFGEVTEDLHAFASLLRNADASKNFFHNFSNTGVFNEIGGILSQPLKRARYLLFNLGAGGQFSRKQGRGTLFGKEFLQEGRVPNFLEYLHAHRKLAGISRTAGQVGSRFYEEERGPMEELVGVGQEPVQPSRAQSREAYR